MTPLEIGISSILALSTSFFIFTLHNLSKKNYDLMLDLASRNNEFNRLQEEASRIQIEVEKYRYLEKNPPKKQDSYEVIELIHDLTAGRALVEIRRIDPTSFFIRSPKDMQ